MAKAKTSTGSDGKKHYLLSPSAAHRWIPCPGEPNLRKQVPNKTSDFALEGTTAHWVAEQCLKGRGPAKKPQHYIGMICPETGMEATDEMADYVGIYVDDCNSYIDRAVWHAIEAEFTLPHLSKDLGGTADCAVYVEGRNSNGGIESTLTVRDLKYGKGYWVDVADNPQLQIYALGALEQLRKADNNKAVLTKSINLGICQPRMDENQPVRAITFGVQELIHYQETVLRPAIDETYNNPDKLVAGDHCRFCPAIHICPAQSKKMLSIAQIEFARPLKTPKAPEQMTPTQVFAVLQAKPLLENWLKGIEAHAQTLIENGVKTPHFKLVNKRRNRAWREGAEPKVKKMLGAQAFKPQVLVSVAQAEKIMEKAGFDLPPVLYDRPDSGVVIAPMSDKRPAAERRPASLDFTPVVDEEDII